MKPKSPLSSNITPEQLASLTEKVPEYLRVSPELAAEIKEEQRKLREKFNQLHAKPSDRDVELQLAIRYEQAAREFFQAVEEGYAAPVEERNFNARRLAQSLQTQGRYDEAIAALLTGPAPEHNDADVDRLLEELVSESEAIQKPDDEFCSCVSSTGFPTTHIVKQVRKPNGEFVPVVRCTNCGHRNATNQKPEELSRLDRLRNRPGKAPDSELIKQR